MVSNQWAEQLTQKAQREHDERLAMEAQPAPDPGWLVEVVMNGRRHWRCAYRDPSGQITSGLTENRQAARTYETWALAVVHSAAVAGSEVVRAW